MLCIDYKCVQDRTLSFGKGHIQKIMQKLVLDFDFLGIFGIFSFQILDKQTLWWTLENTAFLQNCSL